MVLVTISQSGMQTSRLHTVEADATCRVKAGEHPRGRPRVPLPVPEETDSERLRNGISLLYFIRMITMQAVPHRGRLFRPRAGFSLLEVIIATAILSASTVLLLATFSAGQRHAERAESKVIAQLLCQSKLDEILANPSMLAVNPGESFPENPEWAWSVALAPASVPGMAVVQVRIYRLADDGVTSLSAPGRPKSLAAHADRHLPGQATEGNSGRSNSTRSWGRERASDSSRQINGRSAGPQTGSTGASGVVLPEKPTCELQRWVRAILSDDLLSDHPNLFSPENDRETGLRRMPLNMRGRQ